MKKFLLILVAIAISTSAVSAETIAVLNGVPTVKDMSDARKTTEVQLTEAEQAKYPCTIVKRDGEYYWASRKDKRLLYSKSGEFHNFVDPEGAGYVRVLSAEGKIYYMEHLTAGLKNISYWGSAAEFKP